MFRHFLPELRKRSRELDRPVGIADLMEDFWRSPFEASFPAQIFGGASYPSLDISEDEKSVLVSAELPGVRQEDLDIRLHHGLLTIKGEKRFEEEQKEENYHRIERSYGSFSRSVRLPSAVREDDVEATFKDGVLKLTLPKSAEGGAKKIAIG